MHNKAVADIMYKGVISCPLDTPIPEVAHIITQKDISAIVVVDNEGYLAGLISRTDLTVLYGYDEMWPHLRASDVMTRNVFTIQATERAVHAAQKIHQNKISRLIVTELAPNDKEKPIGILSITDIVREMSFH